MRGSPRLLFVAGGTGGHLFPALAVADRCREIVPDAAVRFVGGHGRLEEEVVPRAGYDLDLLWISGFAGLHWRSAMLPLKMARSLMQSRAIIRSFRPDVVVCAGAYVSWPVGRAAIAAKVPLVLMESNALPGRVIRSLAPKADRVHVAFEKAREFLPGARVYNSGNPVRRSLAESIDPAAARRRFNLDPECPTLLVFGGSLGARSINRVLDEQVGRITAAGIQVIWQTGKSYEKGEVTTENLVRTRFIHEMEQAYGAADLVLCRAGATTIAELATLGKPSILVPLPTAADDHQTVNARAVVEAGGGRMIADVDMDTQLVDEVIDLFDNKAERERMAVDVAALASGDAATAIAEDVLERAGVGRPVAG